jgi:hypothetical protein
MRFVGNPAAYALQQDDGSYKPVRKPVTGSLLKQHLSGEVTVGSYVNVGDQARYICFDVDTGDDAGTQADRVVLAILGMGVPEYAVGTEFSGRKGYHVWVLMQDYRDAAELRAFGRSVLVLADVECEVFPKQDEVRDLGNLVKLPGGKHRVSGLPSKWVTAEPRQVPEARWVEKVVPNLPEVVRGKGAFGGAAERFPCMDHIQTGGAQNGSRNNELFHLATMLRRAGLTQEYVVQVVAAVNAKGDPLDEYELTNLLQSAEYSGPICDTLAKDRQCGDLCIKARTSGLYTRPRQLKNASVGENVVVTVTGKVDQTVTLGHDDLQTAKGALTD